MRAVCHCENEPTQYPAESQLRTTSQPHILRRLLGQFSWRCQEQLLSFFYQHKATLFIHITVMPFRLITSYLGNPGYSVSRAVVYRRCNNRASVMARIFLIGSRMEDDTMPSSRTKATASAPTAAWRRPRANVAMFTPSLPSVEPTSPITPGSSRLRR